jgi:DNA-binding transcriptional LysR family regulator
MDKFMALTVFARVVEQGGFTAAAKKLGLSPSAVTKTIARLEDELDTQLFTRTTRRLRTTDCSGFIRLPTEMAASPD